MELLRIKDLMKERNLTGKDLAERVGVHPVSFSAIANGNSFPKPELLKKIAEELDVDIRELFYPTKDNTGEAVYIERDGRYVRIGEINLSAGEGLKWSRLIPTWSNSTTLETIK